MFKSKRGGKQTRKLLPSLAASSTSNASPSSQIPNVNNILKDPLKLQILKKIIIEHEGKLNELAKQANNRDFRSPLSRAIELPTERRRRMMLEEASSESETTSDYGEASESWGPKKPFSEIFTGVIAFVDVNKMGEDRSGSIKLLMKCMGATVRDKVTSDVTHIIYKEGSFATWEKGRLLNCHVVPIRWIFACKKHSTHVPADNYSLLKSSRARNEELDNTALYLSQIQEDLKDLVRDEKRKSSLPGSKRSSRPSKTSSSSTDNDYCRTPRSSTRKARANSSFVEVRSPDLTSDDDSDCGVVNGHSSSHLIDTHKKIQSELRDSLNEALDKSKLETKIYSKTLNDIRTKKNTTKEKQKINVLSNIVSSPLKTTDTAADNSFTDNSTNIDRFNGGLPETCTISSFALSTEEAGKVAPEATNDKRTSWDTATTMSSLRLSGSQRNSKGAMSPVENQTNKRNSEGTATTMSSLRISDTCKSPTAISLDELAIMAKNNNSVPKSDKVVNSVENQKKKTKKRKRSNGLEDSFQSSDETHGTSSTSVSDKSKRPVSSTPKSTPRKKRVLYNPNDSVHVALTPEDVERARAQTQRSVQVTRTRKSRAAPLSKKLNKTVRKSNICKEPIIEDSPSDSTSSTRLDSDMNLTAVRNHIIQKKSTPKNKTAQIRNNSSQNITESPANNILTEVVGDNNNSNRRSTLEFQVPVNKTKITKNRKPSIVCTRFHRNEYNNFENIVKKLGGFTTELKVTPRTTHLVVAEPKRTINLLKAIAQGCWIVTHDWLLKSERAKKWVSEEDYELTKFSPAVQQCRLERQAFGSSYTADIFGGCGPIYIARKSVPPNADLVDLVKMCHGQITNVYRNARVVVGEFYQNENVTCVTELWILDSIAGNRLKSFRHYVIKDPKTMDGNSSACF